MRLMNVNFCTEPATVVSASSINPNFPVSNLKHPFRSKRVRTQDGVTTLTVTFDMQTAEELDSVVLLWPLEDGIKLTGSATLTVKANATDTWSSPAVSQSLTVDNTYSVASHYFSTPQSYRYWQIEIVDEGNPWDYIELGLVWIGMSLDITNAQNGFKYSLVDRSQTIETDFGHSYSDEYPTSAVMEFSYALLDYEEIQILDEVFRVNGSRKPVLVVVDASSAVFAKDHFTLYGKMTNSLVLTHVNYNILNTDGIKITELS